MKSTKIVTMNEDIKLSKHDFDNLMDIITFVKFGIYYNVGRTCYYKLENPIVINKKKYSYLKIKGNGILKNWKFIIPGSKAFLRTDPHYGFDKNNNPILINSESAPYGGMTLSRALNEYDNFKLLSSYHVSTLYPFCVFEYENLIFHKQKLGVSVALSETPYRFDKILFSKIPKEYLEYYKKVFYNEFGYNTNFCFEDKVKLIQQIAYKYAVEVKKFCDCGLYIHSGGWSNIQYSFIDKNVVLVDLDSSKKNVDNKELLKCRDLVSNIYRLFINLYNPNCISDYTDEIIKKTNYCYYLLKGFFPQIEDKKLLLVANNINEYYIKECFNNIKKIEKIMLDISESEKKKMELNIFEFYNYCINLICDVFKGGDENE